MGLLVYWFAFLTRGIARLLAATLTRTPITLVRLGFLGRTFRRRGKYELSVLPFGLKVDLERSSSLARQLAVDSSSFVGLALLGYLAFVISAYFQPDLQAKVKSLKPDSPAARAGMHAGDVVRSINGVPIEHWGDLRDKIDESLDKPLTMIVERGATLVKLEVVPSLVDGQIRIGIFPDQEAQRRRSSRSSFITAAQRISVTANAIKGALTGRIPAVRSELPGNVGAFALFFTALGSICLVLACVELFPFPRLAMGLLLFTLMQRFTSEERAAMTQQRGRQAGVALVVLLVLIHSWMTFQSMTHAQ